MVTFWEITYIYIYTPTKQKKTMATEILVRIKSLTLP